jgi:hypothetical protein
VPCRDRCRTRRHSRPRRTPLPCNWAGRRTGDSPRRTRSRRRSCRTPSRRRARCTTIQPRRCRTSGRSRRRRTGARSTSNRIQRRGAAAGSPRRSMESIIKGRGPRAG